MDAYFCVAEEAASVLPNERLQTSEGFRRQKLHSSRFLFEMLLKCCAVLWRFITTKVL